MQESERQSEQRRLEYVLQIIRHLLAEGAHRYQKSRGELQQALEGFWEHQSANYFDQAQQAESVDRQRSLTAASYQKRRLLHKMEASPYFGRIDFLEAGAKAEASIQIYIGIGSLTDPQDGVCLIFDWRSPIAGMFYDFEPGPASYDCPAGRINGRITLKRQYKITNGRLESFFDTDLQVDDEILQEILAKSADSKMRTIVTSIQREQNRAIRDESHSLLLIQGPAGSGKTSIALHRAAYLLYAERNRLTAKNILVLSPNQIFSDYISAVLPELGEENIRQMTFHEYLAHFQPHAAVRIEPRDAQLEYLFAHVDEPEHHARVAAIRFKSSPAFTGILTRYVQDLEERAVREYRPLVFRGQEILSRRQWETLYRTTYAYLPPTGRLAEMRRHVRFKMRPLVITLRREKELEIAASGEEVNEKTIKALARIAAYRELLPVVRELNRMTSFAPFALYRELFAAEALFRKLAPPNETPSEWPAIREQTLAWLNEGLIPYEDAMPLVLFQGLLEGFPSNRGIRHLIIDEAQDYSVLQYRILQHLFPECHWTVLGDPDQAVHPYLHSDFAAITRLLNRKDSLAIELTRSYRSTREIQSFCGSLLRQATPHDVVNRSGSKPQVVKTDSAELQTGVIAYLVQDVQKAGCRSVAVICKTGAQAQAVYERLRATIDLHLISREDETYHTGTIVIPVYLAKGLEFDAALIAGADAETYGREEDRHLLYIACTRALHRLVLFHQGELSPLVQDVDPTLYQQSFIPLASI